MRRKVVNRVKFKSTQIRLAFKVLFSVSAPLPFDASLHRANFELTGTEKKSHHGEQLNRYENKIPFVSRTWDRPVALYIEASSTSGR